MKLKISLYSTILFSIFMIGWSCSKQKSPQLSSTEIKSSREIERLDACSKVNFNKGVLLYKNVQDLFVCSRWDEEFPHMFAAIKTIRAESWDHLMSPIDQAFIENQVRRDRVFKNIRELDSAGGLDDLSHVIVALNETNFFDSTKAMFTCIENKLDPLCSNREEKIPSKNSLINVIKIAETNPESIEKLSFIIKSFVGALEDHQESIRDEINKFRTSGIYLPARLALIDALAAKIRAGFSDEDREFLGKILLAGNSSGDQPWLYQWLQDSKMSRTKFRDLLEYPILANPDFIDEIRGLEKAYNNGLACTIKSTSSPNELIEFVFKEHVSKYVGIIKNQTYKDFFDNSASSVLGLKLSTEICRELEKNKYNVNLIKVLSNFADFLGEKKFYDLTKFLLRHSTATGHPHKTFAENIYLFDFFTGNLFSSANALNTSIINNTRDFYPLVYDVVKTLPPESYIAVGEIYNSLMQPENDSKLKGVAAFWHFFTDEEKNFIFRFVDRHFDKDINYILLFDFYTRFLDDLKEVQPLFKEKWTGSQEVEESSYMALEDLFYKLAGKETLLDFKKFFSRDQILKVLEVISNGKNINKLAQEQLRYIYSDNYLEQSRREKYAFKINYDPGFDIAYDSKVVVECMKNFNDIQNGIYEMIRRLPSACTKVTDENIAFRIYGWVNAIDESYLAFKKSTDAKNSLLDKTGLLSPYMLNSTIGLTKILDNLLGPAGSKVPTQDGIAYFLNSADYHLNKKGAHALMEKNLEWLNDFLTVSYEKNSQHRNALLKSVTREDNFSYAKNVFLNVAKLLIDYGGWIKDGSYQKAMNRSLGIHDPKNDCKNVINQFIAPYPCPEPHMIKLYGNELLSLLQNKYEPSKGSPVAAIMKSAKTGEGIDIPPGGKNTKKLRLGLREYFRFFYDTSDKSFSVNNKEVRFTNEAGKTSVEKVTTLERIESVIREVRFGNNYLGVAYQNAVVFGNDYNSDVANRKQLLTKCVRLPFFRCGRRMTDNDLRMANNSVQVFDGLVDANTGYIGETRLNYGDFLKAFQATLVTTSSTEAQRVQLFPLSDTALAKHNGKILTDMAVLSMWSNASRIIRDRVGKTRVEFNEFVESKEFKRVDRALLHGFNLAVASSSAERLLQKLNVVMPGESQNLFGNTVDWLAGLKYEEVRLFEDTVARLMVVGAYLGTPEFVFQKPGFDALNSKYTNNNLFQVFLALEKLIEHWPTLKKYFPEKVSLIEVFKPVNTALYFLTEKLTASEDPEKNVAYLALNDLFLVLQTSLFDELPSPFIAENVSAPTKGLDLLLDSLKNPTLVNKTYSLVQSNYRYLDVFHQNSGESFLTFGENLSRIAHSSKVDLSPLRDYLAFTTKNVICKSGEDLCVTNYHYDEPANLVRFLNKKSESGKSYFSIMNEKIFIQNIDQINQMLDYLMPAIAIKEVKPPLAFN